MSPSKPIQNLFEKYSNYLKEHAVGEDTPRISVDEIASKLAAFYEKVRNLVDYQESHLLRKSIIERALRRRIFLKDISGKDIAESLIKEIIRAGHLPNNTLPESKIGEIQEIVDRFLLLKSELEKKNINSGELSDWMIGIIVCEIESRLAPPTKDIILAESMHESLRDKIALNNAKLSKSDQDSLLFVAIQKSLLRADRDLLHYRLLNFIYPNWFAFDTSKAGDTAAKLRDMKRNVIRYENHKLYKYFFKLTHTYTIVFQLVGDLAFSGSSIDKWEGEATNFYKERYKKEKGRLFRLAFFSIISFFFSKLLVAFAVEYPIDVYVLHHFSWMITVANILFPPFLMFLIVLSVRLPSDKNLGLVLEELRAVLFETKDKAYTINIPKKKSLAVQVVVGLSYVGSFAVFLYFLTKLLLLLDFSAANIVIFVLFTSLVTATGVKIFNRSKDMSMEKEKSKVSMFFLDLITIPLVTIGRYVMAGLKKFNIFIIIMNFFIELPFQVFVEFIENFNSYIKTKKEEIQ